MSFDLFIKRVRGIHSNKTGIFSYYEKKWKIYNQEMLLLQQADFIYDNHVDVFFQNIMSILGETNQNTISSMLRHGLIETMAILSNNKKKFVNCSINGIENGIFQFENNFFKSLDEKRVILFRDELQLIGETAPGYFIKEINCLINDSNNTLIHCLNREKDNAIFTGITYQIVVALTNIAKLERFFSEAMTVLFKIIQLFPCYIDLFVGVVLPWGPQTHASTNVQVGLIRGFAEEDSNLIWKVLMKLMPHVTTYGNPIQYPKYLKVEKISDEFKYADYIETTVKYIRLAEEMVGSDVSRMC